MLISELVVRTLMHVAATYSLETPCCVIAAIVLFFKNFQQSDAIEFLQLVAVCRTRCWMKFVGAPATDNTVHLCFEHTDT
jgi:hypothetical protein